MEAVVQFIENQTTKTKIPPSTMSVSYDDLNEKIWDLKLSRTNGILSTLFLLVSGKPNLERFKWLNYHDERTSMLRDKSF